MTDAEREARKLFDEIDGPFIELTPLGEQKVDIIRVALQKAEEKSFALGYQKGYTEGCQKKETTNGQIDSPKRKM